MAEAELVTIPRHLHVLPLIQVKGESEPRVAVRVVSVHRFNKDFDLSHKKEESFGHGITIQDKRPCAENDIIRTAEALFKKEWSPAQGELKLTYKAFFEKAWGPKNSPVRLYPCVAEIGPVDPQAFSAAAPFLEFRRGQELPFSRDALVFIPASAIGVAKENFKSGPDASRFVIRQDIKAHVPGVDGEVSLKGLPCQNSVFEILEDRALYTPISREEVKALRESLTPALRQNLG